jgi:hypothetical protein
VTIVEKFKFIQSILEEAGVKYWLFCGASLLAYRDHKLPEDDIDFGLLYDEYFKVKAILEKYSDKWTLFNYRYRELTVKLEGTKFDFVFHTCTDSYIYMYSYRQNEHCNMKWNCEWRAKFDKTIFLPLVEREFTITNDGNETITVPTPNNIEKYFAVNYEPDWYIPKDVGTKCWTYNHNPAKDTNYHPIAVVMTTFLRDERMMKVLPSYLKYPVKLYLLDQGNPSPVKNKYYDELRAQGHYIEYSEYDIGLSEARNRLLSQVDQEFVLLTEDDIELVSNPYSLLQSFWNNNLGVLGGLLYRQPESSEQHYEYELSLKEGVLEYKKSDHVDLVLNFALFRNAVFADITYDSKLKLCEHTDFYLRLKQLNKWKVDYTRQLIGNHYSLKEGEYKRYRSRGAEYAEIFKKKWNITSIIKDGRLESTPATKIEKVVEMNKVNVEEVTVFVITCGKDPNYDNCINALNNQVGIKFKLEIIRDYHPMGAAFQEMINRCKTKYYVQIDSDMIMEPGAICGMYDAIKSDKASMVCFRLFDVHLQKNIDGVKIYNHDIFKQFPYKLDVLACEMEQLDRLQKAGHTFVRVNTVLGKHSPIWTKSNIFERYYNYMNKHRKNSSDNYISLAQNLFNIMLQDPTHTNIYAFLGGMSALMSKEIKDTEKDYTLPVINNYKLIDNAFKDYKPSIPKIEAPAIIDRKKLVVHYAHIPCANRPYDTVQLINNHSSKYKAIHVLGSQYSKVHELIPYREFPHQYLMKNDRDVVISLLNEADIIHCHHYISSEIRDIVKNHNKVVFTVSNLGSSSILFATSDNKARDLTIKTYANLITVVDQPAQRAAYGYLSDIVLPLVKYLPNSNMIRNNKNVVVAYAPTNRSECTKTGKGYKQVLEIINELLKEVPFVFDLIEGVPYAENINRKKMADIIIDDVLQPTLHNTSIESGLLGAACLTGYSDINYPFIKTDLTTLKENLKRLITDRAYLEAQCALMREWNKTRYTPENVLKPYEDIYDMILSKDYPKVINLQTGNVVENNFKAAHFVLAPFNYHLLKTSCLDVMREHKLVTEPNTLRVGVSVQVMNHARNALINNGYVHNGNNSFIKDSFKIFLSANNTKLKINTIYGININLPLPVVPHLEQYFGKNWLNNPKI